MQADLAQARQLLDESARQDDPVAEHQYRQRVARLEREAAALERVAEAASPSMNGFVPVFEADWCGDHRLDESKIKAP